MLPNVFGGIFDAFQLPILNYTKSPFNCLVDWSGEWQEEKEQ